MFPVNITSIDDFFINDKPKWNFRTIAFENIKCCFNYVCFNSYMIACNNNNINPNLNEIIIPYHSISPMFKSDNIELYKKFEIDILDCISRFRLNYNMN